MSEMIENEVIEDGENLDNNVTETEVVNCENCDCDHHTVEDCTGECLVCVAENNSVWGEVGHEVTGKFYQVYNGGKILYDDESIYYEGISLASSIVISPEKFNKEFKKYANFPKNEIINVTITVNETLKLENPLALVVIDGNTYDLGVLDSSIEFFMNKDHKISIYWKEGMVETFRFNVLR